jgi:hypothetical protein
MERLRLSDVSRQATAALATLDHAALEALLVQVQSAEAGGVLIEQEPAGAIETSQRIFAEVLAATGRHIDVIERLRARRTGTEWAL